MSQTIQIGIVEDEAMIAENISEILEGLGYQIAGMCMDYDEAIAMLQQNPPDLALLDVKLRGSRKDGIAIAEYIRQHMDIPIVFLTANSDTDTVTRAKQVKPNAFLVKPFQKADLYTAIETAISNFTRKEPTKPAEAPQSRDGSFIAKDAIFIKDGNYFHKVKMGDIRYLASENIYITVHADRKKYLVRASLTEYLEKFDPQKFVRVHQRYAVNIDHVDKINTTYLLINNEEIPISRAYHPALLAKLNLG